ncbi:hypothetical protein Ciccas_001698 [Cichlidogyrus casuarinus]|uniref:Uncharacterized protein n=1 Tax=Cichlidogyrus casuarinus TaxID=1844966 RepID=A0ABD2QJE2_9PLAT
MSRQGFLAPANNHVKRSLEQQPMAVELVATSNFNAAGCRGPKMTRLAPEGKNRRRNPASMPVFPQKVDQLKHMTSSEDSFSGLYPVDYASSSFHGDAHLVSYDTQLRRSSSTCCVPYVPGQSKMADPSHQHDYYQTITRRDSLPSNKESKQSSARLYTSSNHSPVNWHTRVNREVGYQATPDQYHAHSHSFSAKATQNSYPSSTGSFGHLSDNNSPPNQKCGSVSNQPTEERRRMSQQAALQALHRLVLQHSSNPLFRLDDGMGIMNSLDGGSVSRTSKANILQLSAKLIRTERSIQAKLIEEVKQLRLAIENHRNAIRCVISRKTSKIIP